MGCGESSLPSSTEVADDGAMRFFADMPKMSECVTFGMLPTNYFYT